MKAPRENAGAMRGGRLVPVVLACAGAAGCVNDSPFTNIPDRHRPIAVIEGPASPVESFGDHALSGEASHDPDGTVVAFSWTVLEKPDGSGFAAPDEMDGHGATMPFRPDLVGTYRVRLVVTDDDGLDSEPAEYVVQAASTEGLRVELTWNVDISDVDLHLVSEQPGAAFFDEPWDCFFQNREPDWGLPLVKEDDPYLPLDVDDGFGPEVIGIRAPAAGSYRVLSHYYCDDGFGGAVATIRVWSGGSVIAEAVSNLQRTGDLWEVGTVTVGTDGSPAFVVSTAGVGASSRGCE